MLDGKKLQALRKDAELTAEQLGNAVGVSTSMILHMERGFKQPGAEVFCRIADRLGVTVEELRKRRTTQ